MGPPLLQKVHLVQPCSNACPCICVCLPSPPLGPCCSPSCQELHTWDELLSLQPISTQSHLLCHPLAALAASPGAAGRTCTTPLASLCTNILCIPQEQRGRGASMWEQGPSVASAPACAGGTRAGSSEWPAATPEQLLLSLCWHDPA